MFKERSSVWTFAGLSILFIGIILYLTYSFGKSSPTDDRGTFGDMFGAANALFTGLSFVGLIVTILLQRQDLIENDKNLKKQIYSNYVQNFENTFFHLLKLMVDKKESYNETRVREESNVSIFGVMNKFIRNEIHGMINSKLSLNDDLYYMRQDYNDNFKREKALVTREEAILAYRELLKNHHDFLQLYFINIFSLLKYVDNSEIVNKYFYSEIIKSQLSPSELLIINYNALSKVNVNFNELVSKYEILSNLDSSALYNENFDYLRYE